MDNPVNEAPPPSPGEAGSASWLMRRQYISLLRENEIVTANLYAVYARKLHSAAKFWEDLVKDEQAHAEVMMGIEQLIDDGKASFRRPDDFRLPDIKAGITWIRHMIESTEQSGTTLRDALDTAIKVEQTMIESKFFHVMDSDDPAIRKEFEDLHKHTVEHLGRITSRRRRLLW